MSTRRIVVVGLGNPKAYDDTYHSAGTMVIDALQQAYPDEHPAFKSVNSPEKRTAKSIGSKYVLFKSSTLMNISGGFVNRAWRDSLEGQETSKVPLVIIHDDLEEELGVVKIRNWTQSHRGHNGVKDCIAKVRGSKDDKFARISVGIGRPDSREQRDVSDFVLSKVPLRAKAILTGPVVDKVHQALQELETKWDLMDLKAAQKAARDAQEPHKSKNGQSKAKNSTTENNTSSEDSGNEMVKQTKKSRKLERRSKLVEQLEQLTIEDSETLGNSQVDHENATEGPSMARPRRGLTRKA